MEITQDNLSQMAFILRQIADDLESEGLDEWSSFEDAALSTANNVVHDFNEYKKEILKQPNSVDSIVSTVKKEQIVDFDSTEKSSSIVSNN